MTEYMSMDTLRHLLYEVHGLEDFFKYSRYAPYDREAIDLFLDSVKDFADQELYPCFREMDAEPARYENGGIVVHPHMRSILEKGNELGIISGTFSEEEGGLQLPLAVSTAVYYVMEAANNHVPGYFGLTQGAADLIVAFGDATLKAAYVPHMISGRWAGTMCLTEPQAGSSLSDIVTTAYPQADGAYRIKGQKIFISGGDHPYCENFVHLLLARIEGAPPGAKGISLFVVPKLRPTTAGELLPNDVITAGDYQKMGQRGYCTTHLVFGENDDCHGYLVGEPHRGLAYMFQMMNGARIAVGRGAAAIAAAAYYASLRYAQERPQGRRLMRGGKKDLSQEQTLIINHPDVRRMLLLQKAVSEGALSLVLQTAIYHDLSKVSQEKEKYHLLTELLTPVAKTYPAEMGRTAVDNGLQVLGGYGFCSEYILQQYYRDIRIFAIYEGTTGIQSLDLLGRKVIMEDGKALQWLDQELQTTLEAADNFDDLKPYARQFRQQLQLHRQVLEFLLPFADKGEHERLLANATLYMELFGLIIVAWQWLKIGARAKQALITGKMEHAPAFYESKLHTMKFYFQYELPKTAGLAQTLMSEEALTLEVSKELIS